MTECPKCRRTTTQLRIVISALNGMDRDRLEYDAVGVIQATRELLDDILEDLENVDGENKRGNRSPVD